ncbi:carbohydrate kinase [Salinisphaera aquimarina]|uniref:Carbohydrate kinase n=1 Tax=Salinisphaera aquimarina TaxID=2094031 RepID=A0ABV7EQZ0_9GAMM
MPAVSEISSTLPRFVVFGEALTDFVRTADNDWHSAAGGSCWNVARVASTLGVATAWAGSVSRDLFGADIVEKSRAAALDMRFLQQVDKPPLIAMVHETAPPRYFFLGTDTADLAFDESALPAQWQQACEVAHFGCISLVREPLGARLVAIAQRLKARGTRITFDPNYRNLMDARYPALFERMAALADIVKLSDEDLSGIYPDRSLSESLAALRNLAPQTLILYTRGAQGMTLLTPDGMLEQAAIPARGGDSVGAGDGCMGGFVASLLERPEAALAEHLEFTAATAAAICSRTGAHAPSRAEVEALLPD